LENQEKEDAAEIAAEIAQDEAGPSVINDVSSLVKKTSEDEAAEKKRKMEADQDVEMKKTKTDE
jgi:hypothetical protein